MKKLLMIAILILGAAVLLAGGNPLVDAQTAQNIPKEKIYRIK